MSENLRAEAQNGAVLRREGVMLDLDAIEARAKAAIPYERDGSDNLECPLCGGDTDEATVYYAAKPGVASTIVAYGIGDDLRVAEAYVDNGPADTLALLAELRKLREENDIAKGLLETACYQLSKLTGEPWPPKPPEMKP